MRYYLGVDGGQSSTTALIGDETGRVVGYGRGGPCNHIGAAEGKAKFLAAIRGCVEQACGQAEIGAGVSFAAGCLGFSGGAADKEPLIAEAVTIEKRFVTHDALIALAGAMAGGPGVIAIAGTGSISFGRNKADRLVRSGGWGYVFGDEGGGFDLTRQALRAALRMEEGWGPETTLRGRLLEATGAKNANDLLHRFYTTEWPRPRIARLSQLVDAAAQEGDRIAGDLLEQSAALLAGFVSAVRRQLFEREEAVDVAPIGGVFKSAALRSRFQQLVEIDGFGHCIEPRYGPAAGALFEAYRLAGLRPELSGMPELEK